MQAAMLGFGDRLWNASWLATENAVITGRERNLAKYKPGTHDATLIFSDNFGESVLHFPLYEAFKLHLQPILDQVSNAMLNIAPRPLLRQAQRALAIAMCRCSVDEAGCSGPSNAFPDLTMLCLCRPA